MSWTYNIVAIMDVINVNLAELVLVPLQIGAAIDLVFEPINLALIIVGVVAGVVTGAIPGFTGSNAVAIALPFTLVMEPHTALVFMICIYAGAQYGSAIPAILINTPGTAGAAATCLDAYPMSKQGKADDAIGISILASVIAGFLASIALLFFLPYIGDVAFQFTNPEIFVVTLFAIIIIAIALSDNVFKGLVAGLFGMIVAAMPLDPITGQNRLDFGFFELYDEVPFIPVVIGLFAIAELYYLANRDSISTEDVKVGSYRQVLEGFRYTIQRPVEVVRGTALGFSIGSLPGAGASFANFVAWVTAKNSSNDPDSFGEGNPDGVIASESANNAVSAGALVPTLSLGIPGNSTTAVMLAALYLQGVQPGPQFLTEFAVEADALVISLILAQFVLLAFAFVISIYLVKVIMTPASYLIPSIIVVTAIGAYAMRSLTFDIYLMVLFGIIAIMMKEHDYSVVPVIIGVIVGPIAEDSFRRSMLVSGNDPMVFFSSTITLVLWIGILLTIFWKPISTRIMNRVGFGEQVP